MPRLLGQQSGRAGIGAGRADQDPVDRLGPGHDAAGDARETRQLVPGIRVRHERPDVGPVAGALLICAGLVPIVQSFAEFTKAGGTPVPVASPPRLVVRGCYRYVRNPIYVGFLAIMTGQALLFGSRGLLVYTAVAWCIGAAAVRFYEEPTLARKFGTEYAGYRHAVRAWVPRFRPWVPGDVACDREAGRDRRECSQR